MEYSDAAPANAEAVKPEYTETENTKSGYTGEGYTGTEYTEADRTEADAETAGEILQPDAEDGGEEPSDPAGRKKRGKRGKDGKESKGLKWVFLDYALIIGIVILAGFLVQTFLIVNAEIPSGSMENTIMPGDRIFGNRLAYSFEEPARYDIVIFKFPDDERELFIKRIIGLPGETVIISGGEVYVVDSETDTTGIPDEELIADPMMLPGTILTDDSFIAEEMRSGDGYDRVYRVPDDSYFMLGDNRNHSRDSRYWDNKYVSRDKLVGKAMIRYWPLNKITTLGYDGGEESGEQ